MKNKAKNILLIVVFTLLGLGLSGLGLSSFGLGKVNFLKVQAAPLADSGDTFYVDQPRANATLYGTTTLRFKLFDDEDSMPEYSASLFQTDCKTKYGTIVQNDYSIRNSSSVYTKSWNTNGPILDKSSIPNGNYCLKVCVTLKNGTTDYAVCDLRGIKIVDQVNHAPSITSKLSNTNFLVGQNFSYDVNATDADGDTLTYSLTTAPTFLQINPSTGVITSKGTLETVGSYAFVVVVKDGKGGTDSQKYTINVVAKPTANIGSVEITSPTKDSIFKDGVENTIAWKSTNITKISTIEIYYSTDSHEWKKIDSVNAALTSYKWNVKDLTTGDYYILVRVIDAAGVNYEDVSEKFSVVSGSGNIQTAPSIIEVSPKEDSENETVNEIKATFVPTTSKQVKDGSLKVVLDDSDISSKCHLSDNKLVCILENDLSAGKHKVSIEFTDTSEQKAQKDWFFTVKELADTNKGGDGSGINSRSILIVLAICLAVLLLLLIPWTIYILWKRRNGDNTTIETVTEVPPYDTSSYNLGNDLGTYGAPAAPVVTSTSTIATPSASIEPEEDNEDEFAIGEGSVGADDFTQITPASSTTTSTQVVVPPPVSSSPAPAPEPVVTTTSTTSAVPTTVDTSITTTNPSSTSALDSQLGDDDIPDWLKAEDLDAGAEPIDAQGKKIDLDTVDEQKVDDAGSQPYSDYGLASQDGTNQASSSTGTASSSTGSAV